jgi:hypothetical protein
MWESVLIGSFSLILFIFVDFYQWCLFYLCLPVIGSMLLANTLIKEWNYYYYYYYY